MPLRRAKNSALGKGGTLGDGEAGAEKLTTGGSGKGLEVVAAPALKDVDELFKTSRMGVGTGASVDKISSISVSRCVVPSRGRDKVAAEAVSRSTATTSPAGDASVGHVLERTKFVSGVAVGARKVLPNCWVIVGLDGDGGPTMIFARSVCCGTVLPLRKRG